MRPLNAVKIENSYPIPIMKDWIDSLEEATFFMALDENWGYWQIHIAVHDKWNDHVHLPFRNVQLE